MESATNKVILSGFAGTDAEVKILSENQKLAKVNLAVHENYRNTSGEEVKKTQWFNLVFWNAKADFAETNIKKGTQLTIEGKLQTGNYVAKDGTKRYTLDILVNEIYFKDSSTLV